MIETILDLKVGDLFKLCPTQVTNYRLIKIEEILNHNCNHKIFRLFCETKSERTMIEKVKLLHENEFRKVFPSFFTDAKRKSKLIKKATLPE